LIVSGFRTFVLVFLLSLTVAGCGRGLRDSLLLTGIRNKPDESKIQVNDVLLIPEDDRVVAPNAPTQASSKRSQAFQVNTILFGEKIAEDEANRQLELAKKNEYTPAEAQLLKHAYRVSANASSDAISQSTEDKRPWWKLRVPKLFGSDK